MAKKKCIKCSNVKRLEDFKKEKGSPDGTRNTCKACASDYNVLSKIRSRGTINGFLSISYSSMLDRVHGTSGPKHYRHYWKSKPIMPREVFVGWSKNHPDFLRLFKRWKMSGKDRKLVPTVNRINSDKGYTLDNVEWVTGSQNSSLAGTARSFNKRRAVYELLGDKNG